MESTQAPSFKNAFVTVMGTGSFATMIASLLARKMEQVVLWYPENREAERLQRERMSSILHKPFRLHENIEVRSDYNIFKEEQQAIFCALPTRIFEDAIEKIIQHLPDKYNHLMVILTKGLVTSQTRRRLKITTYSEFADIKAKEFGKNLSLAVVNGPSLLGEIHASHYTFFNVGCPNLQVAEFVSSMLENEFISTRICDDILGVELGGILKNPIAIACGIAEGLPQSGANLQGVVMSQGFQEMFRFATQLGARPATLMGYSGLADLITTSISPLGRNRGYGASFIRDRLLHTNEPGLIERIELYLRPAHFVEKQILAQAEEVEGGLSLRPILEIAREQGIRMRMFQILLDILSRTSKPEALVKLFGSNLSSLDEEEENLAGKKIGMSLTAGQNFIKLIENRVAHHISGTRGMLDRVQRQSGNVLSKLHKRLANARNKNHPRELEAFPKEIRLWQDIAHAEPDMLRTHIEDTIHYYINEISDTYKPAMRGTLIRAMMPMRFMASGFRPGAGMPYVSGQVEKLKSLSERYNILYAPMHRSHLDSVEVAFGLSWVGLPVPRYAAGINLMPSPFWSWLLKSLGAYAVDRERTRNILYLACLTIYSTMMLEVGIPSLVYPEGTRSRTGDIRPIKTGLLSTAINAYLSSGSEILIVPIALSYENVPEDGQFCANAQETDFNSFLHTRSKVYMDICEPVRVSHHINAEEPGLAIAYEIERNWRIGQTWLPNQIVARILCEIDPSPREKHLHNLVREFIETYKGNYLTLDINKIVKRGIQVLKNRGFIQVRKGRIEIQKPDFVKYYASMITIHENY